MTWAELVLVDALTPNREDDRRICPDCGEEAVSSSTTLVLGALRYVCSCGRWWIA